MSIPYLIRETTLTLLNREPTPIYSISQITQQHHLSNSFYSQNAIKHNIITPNPALKNLTNILTQSNTNKIINRPSKSFKSREFDDRRAEGLCFWRDDKFIPSHKCKNKRLYFLYMIKNEGDIDGEPAEEKKDNYDHISPYISINVIEGSIGCHTLRVIGKVDK